MKTAKKVIRVIIVVTVLIYSGFLLSNAIFQKITSFSEKEIVSYTEEINSYYLESNFMVYADTYLKKEDGFHKKHAIGSAFLFKETENNYYVMTNEHVVNYKTEDDISFVEYFLIDFNEKSYSAKLESYEEESDVAVLSFAKEDVTYNVLNFAKSSPKVYEKVFIISSPLGIQNTITFGNVVLVNDEDVYCSAEIKQGSSGSPLLNKNFEVIALVNRYNPDKEGNWKVTGAINIKKIKNFINNLDFI